MTNSKKLPKTDLSDRIPVRVTLNQKKSLISMHGTPFSGIDGLASSETPHTPIQLGKRQLELLKTTLGSRELALLVILRQHRYATTRQLERWLFHNHHSAISGARMSRRVLARLRDKGLIAPLDRRVGGIRAGSASYVWRLSAAGERISAPGTKLPHRWRFREPSPAHLDHELGITETHLQLVEASRSTLLDLIDATTEPSCWRTFMQGGGNAVTLKPDMFAITASGDFEDVWFIEWDNATESIPTIVRKALVYEAYRKTGQEQKRSGVFPQVLWIVPTQERADKITTALEASQLVTQAMHIATTRDNVVNVVSGSGVSQ
ncbi:MAG: hypothetical protein JWQ19_592 [Subtercola sp.]|nr:hypothetical protein [Subtercola sp.]